MDMRIDGSGVPPQRPAGGDAGRATVRSGEERLAQVAERLGVDEKALRAANPQYRNGRVNPGQELKLPETGRASTEQRAADPGRADAVRSPASQHETGRVGEARPATPDANAATAGRVEEGRYTSTDDKLTGLDLRRTRIPRGEIGSGEAAAAAHDSTEAARPAGAEEKEAARAEQPFVGRGRPRAAKAPWQAEKEEGAAWKENARPAGSGRKPDRTAHKREG